MAFAVQQWWRGHHMIAIGFITFAWLMAGVAIEAAKNNRNAEPQKFSGSHSRFGPSLVARDFRSCGVSILVLAFEQLI